ncbi:hypothetical protein M422DRAFT_252726 [Sphaerobolus stellatus SS14]|uniref:Timeless N-terminal domain-containing protein n=1 Tax=Sphaerobolus stellatus (strain SS14) TaxID=990650 RepID=A0A0C9VA21_SPHS4|nr:hypothetical protein M422DRAFT_252726 [Sphaerobolus stellatus SS14]
MDLDEDHYEDVSREGSPEVDRVAILTPAITSVITALGGQQGGQYVLGDEAYGCLKDLKKFWRKDDTDDEHGWEGQGRGPMRDYLRGNYRVNDVAD